MRTPSIVIGPEERDAAGTINRQTGGGGTFKSCCESHCVSRSPQNTRNKNKRHGLFECSEDFTQFPTEDIRTDPDYFRTDVLRKKHGADEACEEVPGRSVFLFAHQIRQRHSLFSDGDGHS
ncbi:hypothetical protein PO909_020043 [Leuciscus waleckii]